MKKLATTLGILILVGVLAAPVLAHRGGWGDWSRGSGNCWQGSGPDANLTESQIAELDRLEEKFFNDTAKLRDDIWVKSEQLDTLLNSAEPDVKKVKAVQKELTDLRAKMDRQRIDFQLEARKITPNSGYARGYSRGYGRHMMGHGPGYSRGYGQHMMGHGGGYGHGPRHWN
jgi:zinc resistance-associated protein